MCTPPEILFDQAERYRSLGRLHRRSPRDVNLEHQQLAEAALARNVTKACDLAEKHIRRTADNILTTVPGLTVRSGSRWNPWPCARCSQAQRTRTISDDGIIDGPRFRSSWIGCTGRALTLALLWRAAFYLRWIRSGKGKARMGCAPAATRAFAMAGAIDIAGACKVLECAANMPNRRRPDPARYYNLRYYEAAVR